MIDTAEPLPKSICANINLYAYKLIDSVLFAPLVMTLGRSKALKVSMVRNSTDTSIVGYSKGIVIEKKLRTLPHPSTFAAS